MATDVRYQDASERGLTLADQQRHSARKRRRNELQRARRASPEAKAKEARASRLSYYRREDARLVALGTGWNNNTLDCKCGWCAKAARAIEG